MKTNRVNEMMATMKSFSKDKYQKNELLTEMFALQQEIVGLTFNGDHASTADLKIWDEEKHRAYCGGSARAIRENFQKAAGLGVPIIARTPVVPGVNDSEEELLPIARFLAPLRAVQRYELLPYHPLGQEKARALGQEQPRFPTPAPEKMAALRQACQLSRLRRQEGIIS